jgi:hypothetical protein
MSAVATHAPDPDDGMLTADEVYQAAFDDGKQAANAHTLVLRKLDRLIGFAMAFSPNVLSIGEAYIDPIAEINDVDVTSARNLAVMAAFDAIKRIANES